jgi:hypothetical protein
MRGLKGRDRLLSRNRWKRVKKLIEAMSSFEIVEEVPQRYTCANEYGSPAQYFWIAMDDRSLVAHESLYAADAGSVLIAIYLKRRIHPSRLVFVPFVLGSGVTFTF